MTIHLSTHLRTKHEHIVMYGYESWTLKKAVLVGCLSFMSDSATPWTAARQAPLSVGIL